MAYAMDKIILGVVFCFFCCVFEGSIWCLVGFGIQGIIYVDPSLFREGY